MAVYKVTANLPDDLTSATERRRAGIVVDRVKGYEGELTPEQLKEIKADPYLTVEKAKAAAADDDAANKAAAAAAKKAEKEAAAKAKAEADAKAATEADAANKAAGQPAGEGADQSQGQQPAAA